MKRYLMLIGGVLAPMAAMAAGETNALGVIESVSGTINTTVTGAFPFLATIIGLGAGVWLAFVVYRWAKRALK